MLCQKANQQFNWHGGFCFCAKINKSSFDEFIFNINDVRRKILFISKIRDYVLTWVEQRISKQYTNRFIEVARPFITNNA